MIDETDIEVYQTDWGTWHYRVFAGGIAVVSDCGSLSTWEWWGRRAAIRAARRAARKYMRNDRRGDRSYRETVTLDGRPSRVQLERKIAELEREVLPD